MNHHIIANPALEEMLDAEYLTADLKELAELICPNVPARKDERVQAIVQTLFADLQGILANSIYLVSMPCLKQFTPGTEPLNPGCLSINMDLLPGPRRETGMAGR